MSVCLSYVYAGWHLNESSGATAADFSGNGRDGTLVNMEDGDWVAGKLNNCLYFQEGGEYVTCGDIANFDKDDSFSVEFWMKTSSDNDYIMSRRDNTLKGWGVWTQDHKLLFILCNTYGSNQIIVHSASNIDDNAWHHVVITYSGSGTGSGVHIYIDNVDEDTDIASDTLTGSISNSADFNLASRTNKTTGVTYQGYLDEVVIYDRALTSEQVSERWNSGNGTETFITAPPNAPSNPNPTDTESDVEYNRDLTWDCTHPDGVDMTYDVYLDTITPPVSKVGSDLNVKEYSPANYEALQTYYWKVVAKDACGNETASSIWEFDTRNESPVTPNTPFPSQNAIDIPISVTLTWDCEDYNTGDTLTYDIYFGESSNPPLVKSNHSGKSYALSPLSYDTKYYWKIVARDNHGAETTSPIWNFTTVSEGLEGFNVYDPRDLVRQSIGYSKFDFDRNEDYKYIKVDNDAGHEIEVKIYLDEEIRSRQLPTFPFISLKLANVIYEVHDIAAAVRKKIAYIDVDIVYADMDDITIYDFGKAVRDKIYDYIRSYQETITGIYFMTIENERMIEEEYQLEKEGRQVVFHYLMTLRCESHDAC